MLRKVFPISNGMKKNIVQDVIPPKKSIRSVELSLEERHPAPKIKGEKVVKQKAGGDWIIDVFDKNGFRRTRVTGNHGRATKTEIWTPFDARQGWSTKTTHEDLGPNKVVETHEKFDKNGKQIGGERETTVGAGKDTKTTREIYNPETGKWEAAK